MSTERTDTELSERAAFNQEIARARTTTDVLAIVDSPSANLTAVNVATALHRLAVLNKRNRAGRDVLLRDGRFEALMDATIAQAPRFSARSLSEVLWSCATLQHWPATLLTPLLTTVSYRLDKNRFQPHHLSTVVWALGKLLCKPTRLLERIEVQAIPHLAQMNMQNFANLLWGFATLRYQPSVLLPELTAALTKSELISSAKPVEISDTAFALERLTKPGENADLLRAIADHAGPEGILSDFSSRQLVTLIQAYTKLEATAELPEGRLDEWIATVRSAHESRSLLVYDAKALEASLEKLGLDASWIKRAEILNQWAELAGGRASGAQRSYTEDDLAAVFNAIDVDNSGDIDLSELRTAIAAINTEMSEEDVADMLQFGDVDGDMEVSFEEFKRIMAFEPADKSA